VLNTRRALACNPNTHSMSRGGCDGQLLHERGLPQRPLPHQRRRQVRCSQAHPTACLRLTATQASHKNTGMKPSHRSKQHGSAPRSASFSAARSRSASTPPPAAPVAPSQLSHTPAASSPLTVHIAHHASLITHHSSRITHHASLITHHSSRITHCHRCPAGALLARPQLRPLQLPRGLARRGLFGCGTTTHHLEQSLHTQLHMNTRPHHVGAVPVLRLGDVGRWEQASGLTPAPRPCRAAHWAPALRAAALASAYPLRLLNAPSLPALSLCRRSVRQRRRVPRAAPARRLDPACLGLLLNLRGALP
jgi:hypothetical protein